MWSIGCATIWFQSNANSQKTKTIVGLTEINWNVCPPSAKSDQLSWPTLVTNDDENWRSAKANCLITAFSHFALRRFKSIEMGLEILCGPVVLNFSASGGMYLKIKKTIAVMMGHEISNGTCQIAPNMGAKAAIAIAIGAMKTTS